MYVKRDLEDTLRRYLDSPEMLLILGPRQSGKSTLIQHVAAQFPKSNLISFEDVDLLALFEADPKAFASLHVEGYRTVFIDEAQYAPSFGKHMKYLIDTYKGRVKFVATGSSVTDFYLQGLKFLVGRVFVFHLYPFSFREFLRHRNEKLLPLVDRPELQPECKKLLAEFVTYGGYPRAVLAESLEEKRLVLKNLYNLLIQREIVSLAKLLDQQKTIALVRLLAVQNGNLINYNSLASDCSLTVHQLKGLLDLLQKTFVVKLVPPFFTNKSLEIVKIPKVFFVDTGLRNAVLDNFST
ncbi:MAG: ATP-binding protein, partial [Calditrichaeota bacterium]